MKILFVTPYYLCNNAISNCLQNIYGELSNDCKIDVACFNLLADKTVDSQVEVHYIEDFANGNDKMTYKRNLSLIYKKYSGVRKIINMIKYTFYKIISKLPFSPRLKYAIMGYGNVKQLEKLIAENDYNYVISVCYPFSCHYLMSKVKKRFPQIKWIAYYFDPYSHNVKEKYPFELKCNFEYKVLSNVDGILLTSKLYDEFSGCRLKSFLDRAIVCEFPNLVRHVSNSLNSPICFESDNINCVFVGYIYSNIRSPKYFLDMMISADKNIKFYMVGSSDYDITYYKERLGVRLEIIDAVSINEAFKIMNDADILINIGNSVQNQLPSKIIDYISTGKPIVNTCKHDNCLTLPYMKKYPLSLNIFEKDKISDADVREFENFCRNAKGKKIEFAEIQKLYETSTPKYVSNQIMGILK